MFRSKHKAEDRYSVLNTFKHMYQEEKNTSSRDWEQVQIEQFFQMFQLAAFVSVPQAVFSFALSSKQSSVQEHNSLLFWSLQTASNPENFFQDQTPQEKANDSWVMLFLMPVSLPRHHFYATSTEDDSFGTASVQKIWKPY